MRRYIDQMEHIVDPDEWVAVHVAFHLAIASAAGNQSLLQIMKSVWGLLHVWIHRVMQSPDAAAPTRAEHAAVRKAIERRDPEEARS